MYMRRADGMIIFQHQNALARLESQFVQENGQNTLIMTAVNEITSPELAGPVRLAAQSKL